MSEKERRQDLLVAEHAARTGAAPEKHEWDWVAERLNQELTRVRLELGQAQREAIDTGDKRGKLRAEIAQLREANTAMHEAAVADKQTHDESVKLIDHLRAEVDQHRSTINELRDERDRLRETLRQVTERAEHLQIENEGLSVERRQAHEECVGLRSENDKLRATLRHTAYTAPDITPATTFRTKNLGQIRDGLKDFLDWIDADPGNLAFMEERDDTIARLRKHLAPQPKATIKSVLYEMRDRTAPDHDPVKSPSHYTSHPSGVECFDIVEHMTFCLGSAVKYIWRADLKGNAIQDLEKAITNINREISRIRRKAEEQAAEVKELDN